MRADSRGRSRARVGRAGLAAGLASITLLGAACSSSSGDAGPTAASPATTPATVATSDGAPPSDGTTSPSPTLPPDTDPSPTPAAPVAPSTTSPSPDPTDLRVAIEEVATGLDMPVHAFATAGRSMVVEQVGRVTDLDTGEPWLDITDRVRSGGEQGLLGVAVHPTGGHVVAHWTAADGSTTLATYPLVDGAPSVDDEVVVLRVEQPARNHNGGSALFGPDGELWLALGDGGASGDRFGNGQDPTTLLGALLRLDLDDPSVARVPADNPFVGDDAGRDEVWAYGLRNPYRIAFDDEQVYVADVGQDAVEEVTVLRLDQRGANLGWPVVEGDRCFAGDCDLGAFEPADVTYTHAETGGCSVIGGLVYEATALPALGGHFLYADLCAGILRTVRAEAGVPVDAYDLTDQVGSVAGVTGIGAGADAEPLLTTADGRVLRLVPAS